MPKVALVFPYFRTRARTELLLPPLGIAVLAAHLRRLGLEARLFDCTFSDPARLRRELVAYRPDMVGLSVMVSLTANALRVGAMVRAELPSALLVAGGPLPTVFPHRYAPHVDAVFRGEADVSFPRFCADYFERQPPPGELALLPLHSYPGLFVGEGAVDNAPVHHTQDEVAEFPAPDRDGIDHAAYQRAWRARTGHTVTSLLATYGCPYHCEFCSKPVFGDVVRRRPLDAVAAEVDALRALGYDGLWVGDDTLTLDQAYLEGFCERVGARGVTWSCLSRANGIRPGVARLMREAGCRRVYLGLESGSDEVLRLMGKGLTVADGERAVEVFGAAGIKVAAFFIVGYPGETIATIEDTFRLALRLPLDEVSFTVPVPLPGSRLFDRLGRPDEGRDWSHENEVTFVYPTDVDEAWLRRRVEETLGAFARRRRGGRPLPVGEPAR